MKNKELIGKFKLRYQLTSNESVAVALGIAPSHLSAYVNEKRPMPVAMKFRLLQHIDATENIERVAAYFVDLEEHLALMSEEVNRARELRDSHGLAKYKNQKEIDQLIKLKIERNLTDQEVAVFIETDKDHIEKVLNGEEILGKKSKAFLYVTNLGSDAMKKFIDLLPMSAETKKAWKFASNEYVKENLKKRIKHDQA